MIEKKCVSVPYQVLIKWSLIMNKVLSLYHKVTRFPFGHKIFSLMVSFKAPYFSTVNPLVNDVRANYCECVIKKQRKVYNHIQTVHVIAICNGLEMAMGIMAEASIPKHLRWIPKGMTVDYVAKANSDIRCIAQIDAQQWAVGDVVVKVTALDKDDVIVVAGHIKLWVSEKPIKD